MNTSVFPRMHASLYVSNLENTIRFYTDFFGIPPVKVKPGYAKFVLEQPSLIISFIENEKRMQPHFGHLGFQVETIGQLIDRKNEAEKKQLITREETGTTCCYAKQDKFWVTDPDGVQWEVYYFHEDAEFNDPFYEGTSEAACCLPQSSEEMMAAL